MTAFATMLAERVEAYVELRRSLGYAFQNQAAILRALVRYLEAGQLAGPFTREMGSNFVLSWEGTANGRAIRHAVLRRFCEYLAIYDARTEALDPRAFPRSRAIPPPRILSDEELGSPAADETPSADIMISIELRHGRTLRLPSTLRCHEIRRLVAAVESA